MRSAFTLIELLVVITIIVVLLSLLIPALEKAVYNAKVTVCGARQKALATATTFYAGDNDRRYPKETQDRYGPDVLTFNIDLRDEIDPYVDINGVFNDPLLHTLEFENPKWPNPWLHASNRWYTSWAPVGGKAMNKIGDRMKWTDNFAPMPVARVTTLMAADTLIRQPTGWGTSSHPDANDVYREGWLDGGEGAQPFSPEMQVILTAGWTADAFRPPTFAGWSAPSGTPPPDRGTLDLNWGYTDGSVIRIDHIEVLDDRFATFPEGANQYRIPAR